MMKKIFTLLLTMFLLCGTLTACGGISNPATVKTETLQEIVTLYAEEDIKSVLKNPQSLMINNLTFNEDPIEIDGCCYCNFDVDFSAQNGFGGYDREVITYYLCYESDNIRPLKKGEYFCELDTARYGSQLDTIADGVYFSYGCSSASMKSIYGELAAKGLNHFTGFGHNLTDNIDNTTCVKYVCNLMDFEGCMEYFFIDENVKYASFTWQPSFHYVDMKNYIVEEIGVGQTATPADMDMIVSKIDDVLGIGHTETKSQNYQSWADPRAYQWELSPQRKLIFEYVWEVTNAATNPIINYDKVIAFELVVENAFSSKEE